MKYYLILRIRRPRSPTSRGQILLMVKLPRKNRSQTVQGFKRPSEMLVPTIYFPQLSMSTSADIEIYSAKSASVFTVPVCRRAIPYFYGWTSLPTMPAQREKDRNDRDGICNQLHHHHRRHPPPAWMGLHLLRHQTAHTSKNLPITSYQWRNLDLKQTMQMVLTMTWTIKSRRIMRTQDRRIR